MRTVFGRMMLGASLLTAGVHATADDATKPDPQMQAVLDSLKSLKPKPIEKLSPDEARMQPGAADAVKALLDKQGKSTAPMAVGKVEDKSVAGPAGEIPIRVYTPKGDGPFPVLEYIHGGGWVIGTINTYDASCRELCDMAGCVVVSVEYRKGPEHAFPAAPEDCFAAYQWIVANAASIMGDPKKVAVGGESAGGNLATVVAMMAKEKGAPMPVFQLLIYPVTNHFFDTDSYKENKSAKPLNKPMMEWFWKHYLANDADGSNPHASPLQAKDEQLKGLPPAMVITDSIDPLMSEGKAYADKLKAAGVMVTYKNFEGVTHEFFGMGAVLDKAKEAETDAANALKTAFGK